MFDTHNSNALPKGEFQGHAQVRHGLRVLRFWNAQVIGDLDRVSWTILSA